MKEEAEGRDRWLIESLDEKEQHIREWRTHEVDKRMRSCFV